MNVTAEMIEAGLSAWKESAGDEYPHNSSTNDLTVQDIYCAMRLASRADVMASAAKWIRDYAEIKRSEFKTDK